VTKDENCAAVLPGSIRAPGRAADTAGNASSRRHSALSMARLRRYALVIVAMLGLAAGVLVWAAGDRSLADLFFTLGTIPVAASLAASIVRAIKAGWLGVDGIALLSMASAPALGEPLAGAVVASCILAVACSKTLPSHGRSAICAR
jgi:hypothetical protein